MSKDSPANVMRHLAEHMAKELGVEVDHESFDKTASSLDKIVILEARPAAGIYLRSFVLPRSHGKTDIGALERAYYTPPTLFAPYGREKVNHWRESFVVSLRKQGFRICHAQSARKHRKRGDFVVQLGGGRFAWKPRTLFLVGSYYCGGAVGPRPGEVAALLSSKCEHVGVLPPESYS